MRGLPLSVPLLTLLFFVFSLTGNALIADPAFSNVAYAKKGDKDKDKDNDKKGLKHRVDALETGAADLQNQIDTIELTPGPQGDEGPQGPQGIQGIQGIPGSVGLQGETGPQGIPGNDGTNGINGTNGTDGAPGEKGDTGPRGLEGQAGFQGPQGDTGPQGPEGPTDPLLSKPNIVKLMSASGLAKTVFITSAGYKVTEFGPALLGADAICQAHAMSINSKVLRSGTYKAWLSTSISGESPASRFSRSLSPYLLPNGERVAKNYDDLVDGTIENQIDVTDSGTSLPRQAAWTGTKSDGTADQNTCANWTSTTARGRIGISNQRNGWWSEEAANQCTQWYRLYCFQQ